MSAEGKVTGLMGDSIQIFTDGSEIYEEVGGGVFLEPLQIHNNISKRLLRRLSDRRFGDTACDVEPIVQACISCGNHDAL